MRITNFADIIEEAAGKRRKRLVLAPAPEGGLPEALSRAARDGIVFPIWIGKARAGNQLFETQRIEPYEILDEPEPEKALKLALSLLREGKADILLQGDMAHQPFLDAVLDRETGIGEGKLASFVSLFDPPAPAKLTMITDTYINNFPSLTEKIAIVENAVRLSNLLGLAAPKIAALSAIEQVNPAIRSTLDAAVLAKMSERKQFGQAVIEGPLDIDCAVSEKAAARKGVHSAVTGQTDIYLVPNVEAGTLTTQMFVFVARIPVAGVLMGTSCPVILDLPFVPRENKRVEIALAVLLSGG